MAGRIAQERFTLIDSGAGAPAASFAHEVKAGLTARPKRLPCRFFYDQEGSLLFEAICQLPEYYLMRAEQEILEERAAELACLFPRDATLMELGSGSAAKTRILIEAFLRQSGRLRYVPVDISRSMLEESARALLADYPGLEILAVAGEYHQAFAHVQGETDPRKLILWLGSNVGNFDRAEAARFLHFLRERMSGQDRLLVGIDLRKDRRVLEPAYDDAQQVTARFNRNILARSNRELGGHFDLSAFHHRALYNEEAGRIEMDLVSAIRQTVRMDGLGLEVSFELGETIHTENSYKYSLAEIEELVAAARLRTERQWLDKGRRFSVNLLAPAE